MIGIYKITNTINGKIYIGQSINIKQRWKQHRANASVRTEAIYLAFQKYGIENFTFEIIEECKEEELDEKEQYYIGFYDSYNNGYNMTKGGQYNKDFYSQEVYELWDKGKSVGDICLILGLSRQSVYNRLIEYSNYTVIESRRRTGKESYEKQLKNNTLPEHMKPKQIYQYDIWGNKIRCWNSASQISKELKLDKSLISKAIKGEYLQVGGYQWKMNNDCASDISGKINSKFGIIQKNLEGKELNRFKSLKDLELYLNKYPTSVAKCLKGKQKTAYGFLWEYDYSIWDEKPYQRGDIYNDYK